MHLTFTACENLKFRSTWHANSREKSDLFITSANGLLNNKNSRQRKEIRMYMSGSSDEKRSQKMKLRPV